MVEFTTQLLAGALNKMSSKSVVATNLVYKIASIACPSDKMRIAPRIQRKEKHCYTIPVQEVVSRFVTTIEP